MPHIEEENLPMEPDVLTSSLPHIKQALLFAIEQQKIDLVYQGQNALPSQQLVGMEALCRIGPGPWGDVTPDQFIPVAEHIGLIAPLERLVFKQLALDLPQLMAAHPDIRIGVNLSIRHITAVDFSSFINGWLDALPQSTIARLDFEITETYFQRILPTVIDGLHALRQRGVRIVMDDFGSGQSSLSRLHTLPFDVIKLDKQFAQQIEHPMVYAIVKAALAFAQEFGIELIAEGVETAEQCQVLQALDCRLVQGFYFSRPQPLAHWLTASNAPSP
jgi:EAL domain-containing protein (putative c-di-GMP-specific phosphodiesterase class I)